MSKEVKQQEEQNTVMPAIALRGLTVFPHVLIHFEVSRELSVKALEQAMTAGSPVFLVGQRDISVESPREQDLYQVGTIANIRQILRMPGDNVRVMVEGQDLDAIHRCADRIVDKINKRILGQ